MAKEIDDRQVAELKAQLSQQQEQFTALLAIVSKLQTGTAAAPVNKPRGEPKGLQEVRFQDNHGNVRRAWMEQRRQVQIVDGADPAHRTVHECEMADLCVELRPGKFHSIEGVPGLDFPSSASQLVTRARWYTVEQEKAVQRYQEDLKRLSAGSTLQQSKPAAPAGTEDLGFKGA